LTEITQQVPLKRRILAHIKLADPITWNAPLLMCICGALASGKFDTSNLSQWGWVLLGALMIGPLCTGFSQSINDYFDRDLDAINDPSRPIPAGEVTLFEAQINWLILGLATLLVSLIFAKPLIVVLAILGLILSAAYSVPPIKLKKHYWLGPPSVGLGYVVFSWCVGHLILTSLTWQSLLVATVNGGIAVGLLFLNDIKSVEGDRKLGLKSLTVELGIHRTLLISYAVINLSLVALLLVALFWGNLWVTGVVFLALLVQAFTQVKLYQSPTHHSFKHYILSNNAFVIVVQFISAFVVGGYFNQVK